jgi:DNA processing protein
VLEVREHGPEAVSAHAVLERELGLLSYTALSRAEADLQAWARSGYRVLTFTGPGYPENLRVAGDRPPLLFVLGGLLARDQRAVAVIGGRQASDTGLATARAVSELLARAGFTVVSGLAAGIDAEAHRAVLALRAGHPERPAEQGAGRVPVTPRTIAVLGTGLDRVYPPEHGELQAQIARHGALVSQFWPGSAPTARSFPARNAVMSGMSLGSVIIEASEHSGTRIQARHALAQGRLVVLMRPALGSAWARSLAQRPGVVVASEPSDVLDLFGR